MAPNIILSKCKGNWKRRPSSSLPTAPSSEDTLPSRMPTVSLVVNDPQNQFAVCIATRKSICFGSAGFSSLGGPRLRLVATLPLKAGLFVAGIQIVATPWLAVVNNYRDKSLELGAAN